MLGGSSSSSSSSRFSSHSSGSPALVSVKAEPVETPLGRRTRGAALVINEGGGAYSSAPNSRLVKPKTEPGLAAVKSEHDAALPVEATMTGARAEWGRRAMERQRSPLVVSAARRRGRDEGGVIVLKDNNDNAPPPAKTVHQGDPGQGPAGMAAV